MQIIIINSVFRKSIVYFQVFVTVVIFGLFHGLVYLPVILSWVGPAPYDTAEPVSKPRECTIEDRLKEQESSLLASKENKEKITVQLNGFTKVLRIVMNVV